ncbi:MULTISPECIES: group III truncated hemoglobin [Pedobacter]|uniref:group III truncated hemoglobin n=1 Tax=Pedobacter TaxID=84567 RepID=UPI0015662521|nr:MULTISPECIES: group III truncated hemoglobin [Pedobacter]NRF39538.1 group III truncated hemoglobin [Pedobacter foliorum]
MEEQRKDIDTETDVELLVNEFYTKVRNDELLDPIFAAVIKGNWDTHLKLMVDFWSTLLLYTRKYVGAPLPKHLPLKLSNEHFDRWIKLFSETVDELFIGVIAENAKNRALSIARIMKATKGISAD